MQVKGRFTVVSTITSSSLVASLEGHCEGKLSTKACCLRFLRAGVYLSNTKI